MFKLNIFWKFLFPRSDGAISSATDDTGETIANSRTPQEIVADDIFLRNCKVKLEWFELTSWSFCHTIDSNIVDEVIDILTTRYSSFKEYSISKKPIDPSNPQTTEVKFVSPSRPDIRY